MSQNVKTVQRGGSRWYVHPETADKLPGVTSIIGMLPKPFLAFWSAKMAAECAVDNLAAVTSIAASDRAAAVDFVKNASRRYTKVRADVGSAAHDLFERMIRAESIGRVSTDLEPYRAAFGEFLAVVQPRLIRAEDVVWSDEFGYAGSFDGILEILLDDEGQLDLADGTPHLLMVDWKTSKAIYAEVALQMAAYAHAEHIIDAAGTSVPMPAIDGAAVLHVTPDGWDFRLVRIDDEVFTYFLALRRIFRWDRDVSKTVIGRSLAAGMRRLVTGTERRAR